MLLRDGETAILGGLIQDAERNTRVKIPGFGDIPVIGALFTSYDDSVSRTDVLLTITPRIVRGWDVPARAAREFYSGTETVYSDKPLFAGLETGAGTQIRIDPAGGAVAAAPSAPVIVSQPAPVAANVPSPAAAAQSAVPGASAFPTGAPPILAFSEAVYEVASGQDIEIQLLGANLVGATQVPLEILYNPQLLTYVRGTRGDIAADSFNSSADAQRGLLSISLTLSGSTAPAGNAVLARVVLQGAKPGISYLVYRAPAIKTAAGETLSAQLRAARVVIK